MIICEVSFPPRALFPVVYLKRKCLLPEVHFPLSTHSFCYAFLFPFLFINLSPIGFHALFCYRFLPCLSMDLISSWSLDFRLWFLKERDCSHLTNAVLHLYGLLPESPTLTLNTSCVSDSRLSVHFLSLPQAHSVLILFL